MTAICEPEAPVAFNARGKLTLELTTNALCDLNCTYCFEGEKTDDTRLNDIDLLIKRIHEIRNFSWYKEKYTGISLSFWGGEPTLNVDYIIKIMNEFQPCDDVVFHMYTNAFNKKNMKRLIENVPLDKFEVQVSYDGKPINDRYRLTKNKKTTSDIVMQNFEWLSTVGLKALYLKSTVPSGALSHLSETWDDFYKIHKKYEHLSPAVGISFAPTIDYTMTPKGDEKAKNVAIFREQMLKIAKKELEFYKENGRHLCSWFGSGDTKTNCSAGLNMIAFDVDGSTYACHGSLYTLEKNELKSSSIYDDDFLEAVARFNDSFYEPVHTVSDVCRDCVATQCMICPVSTFELSEEEEKFDRWTDRQVNGLCSFYQTFGEIDRTVQSYLLKNNYGKRMARS